MQYDVVIVGGGLAGLTTALSLAPVGLSVAVVESQDPARMQKENFDGRTTAIAHAPQQLFQAIGVWEKLTEDAGAITDIRIVDGDSPLFLHYDHHEVGDAPMGYIVENYRLRKALYEAAEAEERITLYAPARYKEVTFGAQWAEITLESGEVLKGKLVIAADGKRSALRERVGIKVLHWAYAQMGIVCVVAHEKHHNGVAVEHFMSAGPFAILPMAGGHHSSIVWTEQEALVPHLMALDEDAFMAELAVRFGDHLGKLKLASKRWSYPLSLTHARSYTAPRLCLVGDAAHAIHPIAGQGFNLGVRDVAVLADLVADAYRLGLDIGTGTVLQSYEALRRADNLTMVAATDLLNRLFSNDKKVATAARRFGLAMVQRMPPLKRRFMRHAMGHIHPTPRLLKGERA